MTTSSTINQTASIIRLQCPTWCKDTGHTAHELMTQLSIDCDYVVLDKAGLDGTSDPSVLRQLAVSALAAAEWLEANR